MKNERRETVGIELHGVDGAVMKGNEFIGLDKAITARETRNIEISDNILRLENMSEVEINELKETLKEVMEALEVIEKNKGANNIGEKVLGRVSEKAIDALFKLGQYNITGEWNSF